MIFKNILKTFLSLFIFSCASGQDFSNKGNEFWVGYGYHQSMNVDNNQDMVLYFTSDVAATIKVEIPAVGWVRTYNLNANSVKESDPIPKVGSQDARLLVEGTSKAGIHITSDKPIVAYAHIYNSTNSGASLLFPVKTLGQDYYSLNFTQKANTDNSNSWAYAIATEDNTTVEIIPSANTLTHTAGVSFTVLLNKGEIYNLMGKTFENNGEDLTGTRIRSISSGSAGCKKIAVFSGSGRLSINCDNTYATTSDNIIQQAFPRNAWGKKFLTVPTSKLTNNFFRIAVSDPSTVVTVDGVRATNLLKNFYYDIISNTPKGITADRPIMVAQYITSANSSNGPTCGNTNNVNGNPNGDPEMIYLSPIEQTIDNITLNSTDHYQITAHFINVIIKTSAINSFTLDNLGMASSFSKHPQDPNYSYAVFSVQKGPHNLKADSGFNAIAYGYGVLESYGYNAGTNIKDLNQFISLKNPYSTVNYPTTCRDTKFLFAITLPYKPSALTWDFGLDSHIAPNQSVTQNNPLSDSVYTRDDKTLYVYSLPSLYSYNSTGTYPLKITANNQTGEGCNGLQELTYNIEVIEPPVTNFTFTHGGCLTDSVYFNDASDGRNRTLNRWLWQYPDGTVDVVRNPRKLFTVSGSYNIKHSSINDVGCATDTTKMFTIAPQPVAAFNLSNAACQGATVTFADASTIASGKIVKWYWDLGDGRLITNTTNAAVNTVFNTPGNYIVSLQVENESGCRSKIAKQNITVQFSPIIGFDMPGVCLPLGKAVFRNQTTINDGSANSLTYLWNFGDGGTSTETDPQYIYTKPGPFSVNLKATSIFGCSKDSTKVFSNIYSKPAAAFNFNPNKLCDTDTIRFTDASNAQNSTVAVWNWKFGDGRSSSSQNPVIRFSESGSYQVSLFVGSAAGCTSDTARKTIYINKSPTASFAISGSTCENEPFTIMDQSKANSGTINNWTWYFPDGTTESHPNGNSFTRNIAQSGAYTIALVVGTDKGCKSDTFRQAALVRPVPVANFVLPKICANDPFALFKDSSYIAGNSGGGQFTYKWDFGDTNSSATNPNTSNQQNPQHKYVAAGLYRVSLTATSGTGCSASTTKSFTVSSGSPKTDFSIIDDGPVCSNAEVRIRNNSSVDIGSITKVQLVWDSQNNPSIVENDNSPFEGNIYSHTFTAAQTNQTYLVKMVSYSGVNCYSEKVIPVTVNPSPKVTFTPISPICLNDSSRVITEAKETSGIDGAFAFSGVGVSASGSFNPAVAGAGTSTLKYVFTSSAGCKDSASQVIEVTPNPVVSFNSPVYVLEGGSADLNPSIAGNAVKFLWSPATYLNNPNINNPQSVPKDSITYHLTATTQSGCEGTGNVTILILKTLGIPNAFSPNGDGINDVWNIASLASYPGCVVEIYNRYGSIVYRSIGYLKPWNGTFNGSSLPVGVYYYIINLKNGSKPYSGNVTIVK